MYLNQGSEQNVGSVDIWRRGDDSEERPHEKPYKRPDKPPDSTVPPDSDDATRTSGSRTDATSRSDSGEGPRMESIDDRNVPDKPQ